jgi:hypothetical protein
MTAMIFLHLGRIGRIAKAFCYAAVGRRESQTLSPATDVDQRDRATART